MPDFADLERGYRNLWGRCELDAHRVQEVMDVADRILANKARYLEVARQAGVPWYWIAPVHYRESSLDFESVLHNGEKIVGTGKKTKLYPPGRGPFATWEEAAIDALTGRGLDTVGAWPVERMLYEWEAYNGWGYFGRENTPYVWAGTVLSDETGKYVRDHVYDPNAVEKQLGCAAILLGLMERDSAVELAIAGEAPAAAGPEEGAPAQLELSTFSDGELINALIGRQVGRARISNVLLEWSEAPAASSE